MAETKENWLQIDRYLDLLLALDAPEQERELSAISADDVNMAKRLKRLLQGQAVSASLGSLSDSTFCQDALASLPGLGKGDQLGSWKLGKLIGRGGMAEVFEASRDVSGARQQAALKLMALGLGNEEHQRRFRQETEILASLNDHRLARLIDAGTAVDGRPWIAMEFVDGEPIDTACDRQRLGIRERVKLVIDVAMAVDYCHRQLVVHRDLKPSNILLTPRTRIKLLDFGIAKIQDPATGQVDLTATHARAYTLSYASPEQLSGQPGGVGCDIYQLGLVCYQLLVGTRAFADFEANPVQLLQRMQTGPILPSQKAGANDPEPAKLRGLDSKRLRRALQGDLDSIIMRALDANPQARYAGARELADDLRRWLEHQPVLARPYSRSYRAAKYVRRHWVGVAFSAAILALVVGYGVTITAQSARLAEERDQADRARKRAESIQEFVLDVFGIEDPRAGENRGKTIDQLLSESIEQASIKFVDQPILAAELIMDMADVIRRRGRFAEAEKAYRSALALREKYLGDEHPETLDTKLILAHTLERLGDPEQAFQLLEDVLETSSRSMEGPSISLISALHAMGKFELRYGDPKVAQQHLQRALNMHSALRGDGPWDDDRVAEGERWQLEASLALNLLHQNRYPEAEVLLRRLVSQRVGWVGPLDVDGLVVRKNLGHALQAVGKRQEARVVFKQVLADERALYGGAHRNIAYSLGHLANLERDAENFEAAVRIWQQAEAEARAALGGNHPWILSAQIQVSRNMMLGGRSEEGRAFLERIADLSDQDSRNVKKAKKYLKELTATSIGP